MVDLTDVKGLFSLVTFKVAVVFDAFSRMPLSARVFSKEASALEIARFVSKAVRRHGRPAHFISDHARCFTGQVFRRKLLRLEVKQRFGAVGKKGSIALIERPWRTLKDTLGLRLLRPSAAADLAATVELGLVPAPGLRERDDEPNRFLARPADDQCLPLEHGTQIMIRDRDRAYGNEFSRRVRDLGIRSIKTAIRTPKMNC